MLSNIYIKFKTLNGKKDSKEMVWLNFLENRREKTIKPKTGFLKKPTK